MRWSVAFTNFSLRQGAQGLTDPNGEARLNLNAAVIERLYVYAPAGYWGAYRADVAVNSPIVLDLTPVDLAYQDCLRFYYGASRFDDQVAVKVGIVDSGVGPHGDLNLDTASSRNTVTGEPSGDFHDGGSHGTHVAGIVGSGGTPPGGLRGMAPGVELVSFRVFPVHGGASNYAILKAMIYAADAQCDIVNLSLGGGPPDPIVREAIDDARDQGMLVVAAAGNDGRQPVSFPAAYNRVIAVSAMGREGTFPAGSLDEADVLRPPSSTADADEFIAARFRIKAWKSTARDRASASCRRCRTTPFGPMSGTSMAAPAPSPAPRHACCRREQTSTAWPAISSARTPSGTCS